MRQKAQTAIVSLLVVLLSCCSAFQHAFQSPRWPIQLIAHKSASLSAVRPRSASSLQRRRKQPTVPSSLTIPAELKGAKVAVYGEDVDHSEVVAKRLAAALGLPFAKATQPLKLPAHGCVVGKIPHAMMANAGLLRQVSCVLLLRSQADSSKMQEQTRKLQESANVQRLMVFDAEEIDQRMDDVLLQIRHMAKGGLLLRKREKSGDQRSGAVMTWDEKEEKKSPQRMAMTLDEYLGVSEPIAAPVQFAGVEVSGPIRTALERTNIRVPTKIQEMAIPAICRGNNAIVHAETGSGKTLAYLLPLMKRLFELQASRQQTIFPYAMIIVPSRELAVQVAAEVVRLAGGNQRVVQLLADEHDIDANISNRSAVASLTAAPVVIGTPKRLIAAVSRSHAAEWSPSKPLALSEFGLDVLSRVQYLVLDEVDRLLAVPGKHVQTTDQKHRPAAVLLERIASASKITQVVCASATIGRLLRQEIAKLTTSLRNVAWMTFSAPSVTQQLRTTTRAVTVPSAIQHFLLKTQSTATRQWLRCMQQAIDMFQPSRCLLFIPDQQSVTEVVQTLHSRNFTGATLLHEAMGFHTNRSHIASPHRTSIDKLGQLRKKLAGGEVSEQGLPVLVTTHSSARGLHFDEVDLVIVLGVPKSMDEYLHIAGRTGRLGRAGVAVSIVDVHGAKTIRSWETPLSITVQEFPRQVGTSSKRNEVELS